MCGRFISNPATRAQLIPRFVFASSALAFVAVQAVCRDVLVKNLQRKRNTTSSCTMTACYICRPYRPTDTDTNSGVPREPSSDFTASSAVNLPMSNASLRLVVIWTGVESTRCTYSGARVPRRFTFTTNLILFMSSSLKCRDPAIHFMEIKYTTVRGLPHSRQRAFDRDVISPQDGHILCPDPATSDFVSCFQRNSRTVNSTISRPQQI